jgi:hypothetical protein
MPGSTEVVVDTPGTPAVRRTVAIFGGEKKTVSIDAGAPPTEAPHAEPATPPLSSPLHVETPEEEATGRARLRTISYASGAVAIVGLATFAVAGTLSNSAYSDLQAQCHGPCAPGAGNQDEINRGKTEQTLADVGLVVGLVGAAAAVTLFVMSLPTKPDKATAVVVGPTWVGVKGEF